MQTITGMNTQLFTLVPSKHIGKTATPCGRASKIEEALQMLTFADAMIHYAQTMEKNSSAEETYRAQLEAQRGAHKLMEQASAMVERVWGISHEEHTHEAGKFMSDLRNLAEIGRRTFNTTLKVDPTIADWDLAEALYENALDQQDSISAMAFLLPPFQIRGAWAARWYDQGMPRVVWDPPGYAEQLMVSYAGLEMLEEVRAPWKAFIVDLPPKLLYSVHPGTNEVGELTQLLVHTFQDPKGKTRWSFMAQGPSGIELWRHNMETHLLLNTDPQYFTELYKETLSHDDDLVLKYIGNLIIGLCLSFSDPSKIREARRSKPGFNSKRDRKEPAPTRNYVVGAPVKVKVREAIQQSLIEARSNKKTKIAVFAHFVAGHWKKQPYGPQRSLRKVIHVEGYWRNADADVQIVRDHVVSSDS